ncbi:protein of unknown function [Micropruina glycogenica]|uniref:Uncharacterized protein n=1 Tax=Micropruina glycogenica TaxID=75385 RepID=A0A2N9JEI3_9ACTN|nr:protein of unknown function [Micropruina glycogenica]
MMLYQLSHVRMLSATPLGRGAHATITTRRRGRQTDDLTHVKGPGRAARASHEDVRLAVGVPWPCEQGVVDGVAP